MYFWPAILHLLKTLHAFALIAYERTSKEILNQSEFCFLYKLWASFRRKAGGCHLSLRPRWPVLSLRITLHRADMESKSCKKTPNQTKPTTNKPQKPKTPTKNHNLPKPVLNCILSLFFDRFFFFFPQKERGSYLRKATPHHESQVTTRGCLIKTEALESSET